MWGNAERRKNNNNNNNNKKNQKKERERERKKEIRALASIEGRGCFEKGAETNEDVEMKKRTERKRPH